MNRGNIVPRVAGIAIAATIGVASLSAEAVPVTKEYRFVVGALSDFFTGRPIFPPRPVAGGYVRFTFETDAPEFDPDGPGGLFIAPDAVDLSIAGVVYRPDDVEVSIRKFFETTTGLPNFGIVVGGVESSVLGIMQGTNDFQLYGFVEADGRDSLSHFLYSTRFASTIYSGAAQFAGAADVASPAPFSLAAFGIGAAIMLARGNRRRSQENSP